MGDELTYGQMLPISNDVMNGLDELHETMTELFRSTPSEWAERRRVAAAERLAERQAAERVPVTVGALLEKLTWSRAYAEHFVQPYCTCHQGHDGWMDCQHTTDEDVSPYDA